MEQELSFRADLSKLRSRIFRASEKSALDFDKGGFTRTDSQAWNLNKIYQNNFDIPSELRESLTTTIINNIPTTHNNLPMIAVAMYISHILSDKKIKLTSDLIDVYFNRYVKIITSNVLGEDKLILLKLSLVRYLFFINDKMKNYQGYNQIF